MRVSSPKKSKSKKENNEGRISTGIPGLDSLLEGGLIRDSSILIRGDAGTSKTIFCLQYLYYGAKYLNEPGVYISFAESTDAIYKHGMRFGWDFEELAKDGKFAVIRYDPHEVVKIMDEGGGLIRDTIESVGAKRLVVDSLTVYEMFFENKYKANQSMLSLFGLLKKWRVTTFVTSEVPVNLVKDPIDRSGFLTDGVVNLYHIRKGVSRIRALEIVKMKDTNHAEDLHLFEIDKKGIKVLGELKGCGKRG